MQTVIVCKNVKKNGGNVTTLCYNPIHYKTNTFQVKKGKTAYRHSMGKVYKKNTKMIRAH